LGVLHPPTPQVARPCVLTVYNYLDYY
jgi:hypothetical protein